ncbi:MAG: methyltransferase [Magnetospirillum sp. WYHS-4]
MSEAFSEDGLLGGRVRLRQPRAGYRAAIDPVLLAAAAPVRPGQRVLDLGCGAGAAALCLAWRVQEAVVVGLELQPDMADLARHNAAANGLGDRVEILDGDLLHPPADLAPESFDQVIMNPPFQETGQGPPPPHVGKAAAHVEGEAVLGDWLAAGMGFLKSKGWLTLVHRADRLDQLLAGLAGSLEVLPLWPGAGKPARRVIVRVRKDGRAPLVLHPGLVLHQADGRYTPEAEAILRDGAPLT